MRFDETARRRIRWLTRRGLLELDIVLGRFMDAAYADLDDDELAVLAALLDLPDQELLALVNGKQPCHDAALMPLLAKIRQAGALGPQA